MSTTQHTHGTTHSSTSSTGGVQARVVTLTPEWAAELLEKNTRNRPIAPRYVRQYIADLAKEKWDLNGETIKISSEGVILDGQKRLQACVATGKAFETVLVTGLDPIVFRSIDTGQKRTAAHTLSVLGKEHAPKLAAVLRFVGRFYNHENRMTNLSFTNEQIESLLTQHPLVVQSVDYVLGYKKRVMIAPFAVLAGCHYLFARCMPGGPERADAFMQKIITGLGIGGERDPIYQFRDRMSSTTIGKIPEVDCAALLIKAWNYAQEGKEERYLRWRGTGERAEAFPVPYGLPDAEVNSLNLSAVPALEPTSRRRTRSAGG